MQTKTAYEPNIYLHVLSVFSAVQVFNTFQKKAKQLAFYCFLMLSLLLKALGRFASEDIRQSNILLNILSLSDPILFCLVKKKPMDVLENYILLKVLYVALKSHCTSLHMLPSQKSKSALMILYWKIWLESVSPCVMVNHWFLWAQRCRAAKAFSFFQ